MEEEEEELAPATVDSGDNFTETKYLLYGLDLEQQQYVSVEPSLAHRTNHVLGINCSLSLHR